jgi:hypothetical protein
MNDGRQQHAALRVVENPGVLDRPGNIEILDLQNFGSPCDGFPIKGMIFSNIKQEKVF